MVWLGKETKRCHIQDDDLLPIFEKMLQADGIVLASSVYFGSATPEIRALIDRAGYWGGSMGRVFENKVGGPIVVARRVGQNFTFAQLIFHDERGQKPRGKGGELADRPRRDDGYGL